MNTFSKYFLVAVAFFICVTIVFSPLSYADIETGVIVDGSKYSDEPIEISIVPSGSKTINGIDNLVGAKNKLVTLENKDKYVINHYKDDKNNTYQLIYGKGVQNNPTDTKNCYVNGELTKMPRFYGKDGITNLTIVYDEYLHSEETVVFNNTVGDRFTTVINNLGVNDTWSNDGKMFDNQISGLEFINTTVGNYTFSHWVNDAGEIVHNFFIEWENGARRIYNFFAVYDFTPNPEPVENITPEDNGTKPIDNGTVPNGTDNSTDNETINNDTVPVDNGTGNETIIDNTTVNNGTNTTNPVNNETSIQDTNSTVTNPENNTTTSIANSKNSVVSTNLSEQVTGNSFSILSFIAMMLLVVCLALLRDE